MVELEKILLLSVIAVVLELDAYYIGMFLLSQPIIIGGITGYFLGNISAGIILGSIVQLIWINNPPVGAFVPPSITTISFISTIYAIIFLNELSQPNRDAIFMFSLLIGIPTGYFVGQIDIWQRKFNIIIIHKFEDKIKQCKKGYIFLIQIISILAKVIPDLILFIFIIIFGFPLAQKIYLSLPLQLIRALSIAFWMIPIVGLAVVFNMLYSKEGAKLHGIIFFLIYIIFFVAKGKININLLILLTIIIGIILSTYFTFKQKKAI